MAKLTVGQKAERVLKLLLGLRNPRIAEALHHYGFKESDRDEGWQRLRALTGDKLSTRAPQKQDPTLLTELDAWENRWFPVAGASLRGRFPAVNEWLFLNLTQQDGPTVVISVGTLLERLARMATEPSLGKDGAQALELLAQRGLNAGTIQVAKDLLAKLGSAAPAEPASQPDPEAQAKAEGLMWDWYLEWGEIARVAVSERRLLRELGFLNAKRPVGEEDGGESVVAEGAE